MMGIIPTAFSLTAYGQSNNVQELNLSLRNSTYDKVKVISHFLARIDYAAWCSS
jgi:hypothetical protein